MSGPNHDIRSNAGRTIYMPEYYRGEEGFGNLAMPNVYNTDNVTALYPRGTKFEAGERAFYYGKYLGIANAGATTITATAGSDLAGRFLFHNSIQQDMATGLLVRKLANEQHIVYKTTVSAAQSDDFYSGGWVTGKDASAQSPNRPFWRYIVAHEYGAYGSKTAQIWNDSTKVYNEVDLSAEQYCSVLELDQPVIISKVTMATTLMQNPWKRIAWHTSSAYAPARGKVAGACMHNDIAVNSHTWFQTWGPMCTIHLEKALGALGMETLFCMSDGSVSPHGSSYQRFVTDYLPIVGYLLSDPFFVSGSTSAELLPMIFVTVQK